MGLSWMCHPLQGGPLSFSPGSIYAEDGDKGLRAAITYSLLAGTGWGHGGTDTGGTWTWMGRDTWTWVAATWLGSGGHGARGGSQGQCHPLYPSPWRRRCRGGG